MRPLLGITGSGKRRHFFPLAPLFVATAPLFSATASLLVVPPFLVATLPPFGFFAPPLLPGPLSGMAPAPPRGLQDDISLAPSCRSCLPASGSQYRAGSQKRGFLGLLRLRVV